MHSLEVTRNRLLLHRLPNLTKKISLQIDFLRFRNNFAEIPHLQNRLMLMLTK